MNETQDWLVNELNTIEQWEKDQSGLWFWERLGRLPFKWIDKWTPAFIQQKVGNMIDELGQYVQSGGNYLSSIASITAYYPTEKIVTLNEVSRLPIIKMDEAVTKLTNSRRKIATVQGAVTGIGGVFTLSIDIPFLLGMQLKTLQDIAICYGYNPKEKEERLFIIKILQFVSADIVGKQTILRQLSQFEKRKETDQREMASELQGWREVVFTYRDQMGWKKLFQSIPIAGLVFGAFINRSSISDLSEAGMMLYRKRRILERITEETIE